MLLMNCRKSEAKSQGGEVATEEIITSTAALLRKIGAEKHRIINERWVLIVSAPRDMDDLTLSFRLLNTRRDSHHSLTVESLLPSDSRASEYSIYRSKAYLV